MRIQLKHALTQAQWEVSAFILAKGEAGVALDTGAIRVGNGIDTWGNLPTATAAVASVNGQSGTVVLDKADIGLSNVDNTADIAKPISAAQAAVNAAFADQIDNLGSTGGVTAETIGLGEVDNTSDADKPISTATQIALNQKAPTNNPIFTGNVQGISKSMVGLAQVDNTSDMAKPISTAVSAALAQRVTTTDPRLSDARQPVAGSVVNATVATNAAISMDKIADSATRLAMTPSERTEIGASVSIRQNLSAGIVAAGPGALANHGPQVYAERQVIAAGTNALNQATAANQTTAIGVGAMQFSPQSIANIGLGTSALSYVNSSAGLTGVRNVALGESSAYLGTVLTDTISIGHLANAGFKSGTGVISIGKHAARGYLTKGLSGQWESHSNGTATIPSVSIGHESMRMSAGTERNVGIGTFSMRYLSTGSHNVGVGSYSLGSLDRLTGHSGGVVTRPFGLSGTYTWSGAQLTVNINGHGVLVGDRVVLNLSGGSYLSEGEMSRGVVATVVSADTFVVEEAFAGMPIQSLEDAGSVNLVSYERGVATVSAGNVGVGSGAGAGINTGVDTVSVGRSSGPQAANDNIHQNIISIGSFSLSNLQSGNDVVGIGTSVGSSLINADGSVLIGHHVVSPTTTINNTVAIGSDVSVDDNSVAIGNTAVAGPDATSIGSAAEATGAGSLALGGLSTALGANSVALGASAQANGVGGVSIGVNATSDETGIALGSGANSGTEGIAIGVNVASAANEATFASTNYVTHVRGSSVTVGNDPSTTAVTVGNAITNVAIGTSNATGTIAMKASLITADDVAVTSDRRDKTDVRPTQLGLDFINKVQPVEYRWARRSEDNEGRRFHQGVIAQQIQEVIEESDTDFGGFIDQKVNGGPDQLLVRYDEFVAPLIKAVQELSAKVADLEEKLKNA